MSEEVRKLECDHNKEYWKEWYRKYHPHPIFVHFPIALHYFASGLDMIFFFYPKGSFATAIFYTFFVATITGAIAMVPGIFSWWLHYKLAFTYIFIIKLTLSIVTLLLGVIAILIYTNDPEVVYTQSFPSIVYHGIVFSTMLTVTIVSYYGAKLTWSKRRST